MQVRKWHSMTQSHHSSRLMLSLSLFVSADLWSRTWEWTGVSVDHVGGQVRVSCPSPDPASWSYCHLLCQRCRSRCGDTEHHPHPNPWCSLSHQSSCFPRARLRSMPYSYRAFYSRSSLIEKLPARQGSWFHSSWSVRTRYWASGAPWSLLPDHVCLLAST